MYNPALKEKSAVVSYGEIVKLSLPIMIGSAVQNIITLTDTLFLGHYDDGGVAFSAIGLVGIFYLMITTIGYNFSKAGQIIIARRMGEGEAHQINIGLIVRSMLAFILCLAVLFFAITKYLTPWAFSYFIHDAAILKASNDYLQALYTGIARPLVIVYTSLILGITNAVLNYVLIFGHYGFPEMGAAGAAWASTIAEMVIFVAFATHIVLDKGNKPFWLFKSLRIDWALVKAQISLALPIVFQSVVGMGSWLVLFLLVENMGQMELKSSTLLRSVYMMLMIPTWGFSSGLNTIVSNLLGKNEPNLVLSVVKRTALICAATTMILAFGLYLYPYPILYVINEDTMVVNATIPLIPALIALLAALSVGAVYFNGIIGTGATWQSFWIQFLCCIFYLLAIYLSVKVWQSSLFQVWLVECWYWVLTLFVSIWYLRSYRWLSAKV
jgi:multidrug resistance protein, MATE family